MAGDEDIEMQSPTQIDIDKYRQMVQRYFNLHLYTSALFWADKLVSLSNNDPCDVYSLARCMFEMKQYRRAIKLIENTGLDKIDANCKFMIVRCLIEAKEYNDALAALSFDDALDERKYFSETRISGSVCEASHLQLNSPPDTSPTIQGALYKLKAEIYEALDNRTLAADCYKKALTCDVNCYEAFHTLIHHHMLTNAEAEELVESLPWQGVEDEAITKPLYRTMLQTNVESNKEIVLPTALMGNFDVLVANATRLYYNCAYKECFELTQEIIKKDPFHTTCLPVHIACLVELDRRNELFYLAHNLVDLHPDAAISWLAVGCYYYCIGKQDPARRYLGKATLLDNSFGAAWLAYGHSFAAENEHDQAMAAYFKATQLMRGCHLPLLYVGLECSLTSNSGLAYKFYNEARHLAPNDPFVLHELGTVAFLTQKYEKAEQCYLETLARVQEINEPLIADKWEALYNNLGHTCRKLKKYDKAIEYHKEALIHSPINASTISSIGFIHALTGNLLEAIEMFHKALGIRRSDTFSTTMLNFVMEQLMDEDIPFEGAEDLPSIPVPNEEPQKPKKKGWLQHHENHKASTSTRGVAVDTSDDQIGSNDNPDDDQNHSSLSLELDMTDDNVIM